jgi:hypothetical protein
VKANLNRLSGRGGFSCKFCAVAMDPIQSNPLSGELFRQPLIDMLNPKHPLVKLADVIDWPTIEQ